ncbi:hypothetical protein V7S43_004307 [Phytophthora oleae]|uniref:Uncharacterized protein n=1 Tax=Phytophthora oleae TaxID=2107226 RepID=A0ABD3FZC5_9STRA
MSYREDGGSHADQRGYNSRDCDTQSSWQRWPGPARPAGLRSMWSAGQLQPASPKFKKWEASEKLDAEVDCRALMKKHWTNLLKKSTARL